MATATTSQPVQDPLQNLAEDSSIYHNAVNDKRVGQSFTTGAASGELISIEVKTTDKQHWNGGELALDLYELQGNNLVFISSSEIKGYRIPAVNVRNFPPGTQMKPGIQYAFLCRNSARNIFYLAASEGDKYKGGSAFICDVPVVNDKDVSSVNYKPQEGIDLYFKITLKEDPLQSLAEGSSLYHNATPNVHQRIGQSFTTGAATGELKSVEVKLLNKPNWNGGNLALDLYELQGTSLAFVSSSEWKPYQIGVVNVRNFPAGTRLKPNTQYAFLLRNTNLFHVSASEGNVYKGGSAFICDTPMSSDVNAVNYKPQEGFDLYFKVSLV